MVFEDKKNETLHAYLIEIEQWCEETFKDKPMYLRRLPRQQRGDTREIKAGKKLNHFRTSDLYKKSQAKEKEGLNLEELKLIEIYEGIIKRYDYSNLNIQGQNLLDIEQWCRETFEGKPKYLRRVPSDINNGTEGEKERKLAHALSKFKSTPLFKKYEELKKSGKLELNDAEIQLLEKYESIMAEYDYGVLNIHGKNLLEIEQWCSTSFKGKPKFLRKVPSANNENGENEREEKLGYALVRFKKSSLFRKYEISGKNGLNDAEIELLEKYEEIIKKYNYRYLNEIGENLIEIRLWCQENARIPRKNIKGVIAAKKDETETFEQKELRLGRSWSNFKVKNALYKKYIDSGKDELNEVERELIEIFEQIQLEYGAIQRKVSPSKIEYKGTFKNLSQIAEEEKISISTLRSYWNKYGNIDKAVFMCKIKQTKMCEVAISNGNVNLYDLSIILGIPYSELVNLLNDGISIEQIKEQYASKGQTDRQIKQKREHKLLPNGKTLLEYCVSNGLNYSFMYRAINTYGKNLEEATQEYKNKGSKMPKKWIFEKYGLLLRHLFTSMKVNIDVVVDYMRKEYISMDEALEKYIVKRNAKQSNLDTDWIEEVYVFLANSNMSDQYDEFKRLFYIDEAEEECIEKSKSEVQTLSRQLLLFEIAEAIEQNVFLSEEIPELLRMYGVTADEVETIFLDLYSNFENGKLLGENESQMIRRYKLNEIIRKWYNLGQNDREIILSENKVTKEEQQQIEYLSSQIVKHKNMLQATAPTNPQVLIS